MSLSKPNPCNANWLDMKDADGGRLCGDCGNVIVDFTRMSWDEIQAFQVARDSPACGMYHPNQIKHWGRAVPSKANNCPTALATATMLVSALTAAAETTGSALPSTHIVREQSIREATQGDTLKSYVLFGRVSGLDSDGKYQVLTGVEVRIPQVAHTFTDAEGRYCLVIHQNRSDMNRDTLRINHVGYIEQTYPLSQVSEDSTELNFYLDIERDPDTLSAGYFYVPRLSLWQRITWPIRRIFR